jgi:hypothetical protein
MPFYAASCGLQRIMKAFIWTFLAVLLSARWFGPLNFCWNFRIRLRHTEAFRVSSPRAHHGHVSKAASWSKSSWSDNAQRILPNARQTTVHDMIMEKTRLNN